MNLLSPLAFLACFLALMLGMLGFTAVMAWRETRAERKRGQP